MKLASSKVRNLPYFERSMLKSLELFVKLLENKIDG